MSVKFSSKITSIDIDGNREEPCVIQYKEQKEVKELSPTRKKCLCYTVLASLVVLFVMCLATYISGGMLFHFVNNLEDSIAENEWELQNVTAEISLMNGTYHRHLHHPGYKNLHQNPCRERYGRHYHYNLRSKRCMIRMKTRATWEEAKRHCESAGENLLTFPVVEAGPGENQTQLTTSFLMPQGWLKHHFWIGGRRFGQNWTWQGLDTGPIPLSGPHSDWGDGEPNNAGHFEECMEYRTIGIRTGIWNDVPCYMRRGFVCDRLLEAAK